VNKTRSYSTPIFVTVDGKDQMVMSGSKCTAGYDLETGRQIWVCDGPSEQMVATVLAGHGLIFSLGGFPERHLLAIRQGGVGDITKSHIAWRTNKAIPYVPSALLYGNVLHVVSDEGIYSNFDPVTGTVHVRERLSKHISASLLGAEDRVYVFDDLGTMFVLANRPGLHLMAKSSVGEDIYATPALSQGCLVIRGVKNLFCISEHPLRKIEATHADPRIENRSTRPRVSKKTP
jgi:hypothetical protein